MDKENLIPFIDINKQCAKQHYGSLNLTLEVFQDRIVSCSGQQFQRVKFKEGENTDATALVLSEIKDLFEKQESGMFTFTMKFNKGSIKDVYLQRNIKKQYPLDKVMI